MKLNFCILLLSILACSCSALSEATELPNTKSPNVLFIYVEDLGYYTGERAAREPQARINGLKTPNLDALARQSVVFNRTFCGQAVCSPSKGAIYSGLLPHANGIWRNVHNASGKFGPPEKWIPLPSPLLPENDPTNLAVPGMHEDIPNLVQRLRAGGVYCALSGKLHVQPARNFPYNSFVETDDLDRVIKSANGKPWFFWCNPGDTHAPWWKHVQTKLANPKDRNSAPTDVNPDQLTMLPWLPDTPAARIDLAQYYSCVRVIDEFVGNLLKKLDASGQADNTIVVFTGDHGIPCQRGKTSIYPAATHVPCYMKGPGIKSAQVINTPISQMDFNPTFLEAFAIEPIVNTHARSLWPILSGETDTIEGRSTIMTETNNSFMSTQTKNKERGNQTVARAVCDGHFYFIANIIQEKIDLPEDKALFVGSGHGEYGDPGPQYANNLHDETVLQKDSQSLPYELLRQLCMSDAPPEELFDLDSDPWGVHNLINEPAYAEAATRLRKELADWRKSTGDRDLHPSKIPRRNTKPLMDLSSSAKETEIQYVEVANDMVRVGLGTLDREVRLVSMGCFEEPSAESNVHWQGKPAGNVVELKRVGESGRDRLFDRFLLIDSSGQSIGQGHYADRLDNLNALTHTIAWPKNIKGLQAISNWDDAANLGVAHATLNIPITSLIVDQLHQVENVSDEFKYVVDGTVYVFDEARINRIDRDVKAATELGINTVAIILVTAKGQSRANNPLVHPEAELKGSPTGFVAVNTITAEGERSYRAALGFLGRRYSREDRKYGNIGGYIIGNEIQSHWFWHNLGEQTPATVIRQYADQLRLSYNALRQHIRSPKVFASLDHHWCSFHKQNPKRSMEGRALIDGVAADIRTRGDFGWNVAFHPYPENLFKPDFWNDRDAWYSLDTPKITYKNIEVLVDYLNRDELRYQNERRSVILSEQGFHAVETEEGEQLQAAAFAASYVRISEIDGIDAYLLHRYVDSRAEGGLNFGLRRVDDQRQPAEKRLIYDVYRDAGTPEQLETFRFAMPIIGIKSWSEMLPQPGPFPMKQMVSNE